MSHCDRFEREAIPRLEQGLPLDTHFDACPDCRDAEATYRRLKGALAEAGSNLRPRVGWEDRVWTAVQKRGQRSVTVRMPYLRWAAAAALAVALGTPLLWKLQQPPSPGTATMSVEVHRESALDLRGAEAQPGDRLVLEAGTGGASFSEMRLYFNDRDLILRCSEEPPCERSGDQLRAATTMSSVGRYQALFLSSSSPIPAPSGEGLDVDAGRARGAGASLLLPEEVRVR
jgi:hypothetical protein